ncbi:MAG: aminoacyl-tRNA hydrolase [Thermodesulfobacteriota bacterium]
MNLSASIVGLGNPGAKYKLTRHNLGFLVLDRLVGKLKSDFVWDTAESSKLSNGFSFRCRMVGKAETYMLLKPTTYMNNSGIAVAEMVRKNRVDTANLLIVHDELDLDPGRVKMKFGGGLAGHKGLRSIAERLGSRDFPRLRMGIGRPPENMDTASYVLRKFLPEEQALISEAVDRAVSGILIFLEDGFQKAQQWVNSHD